MPDGLTDTAQELERDEEELKRSSLWSRLRKARGLPEAPMPELAPPKPIAPQPIQPRIPPEGLKFNVETEKGETVELLLKGDNTVWREDKNIGTYDPKTDRIAFKQPKLGEQLAYGALKALETIFEPFRRAGVAFAAPFMATPEMQIEQARRQKELQERLAEAKTPEEKKAIYQEEAKLARETFLPGGELRERYEKLPWYQQLLAELPAYIATGGLTATGIRAMLVGAASKRGAVGVTAKVARATLRPVAEVERGIAKAITLPIKGVKKIVKPKVPDKMPAIEDLITANYNPNAAFRIGEKLAEMPGIVGKLNRSLLPMQAAKSDAEKSVIAWMGQGDMAPSLARIEMDAIYAVDRPFIVDALTGLVKNVKPKSVKYKPYIQSIVEFPDRYILTEAQRAELDLLDTILREQLTRELAQGVKVIPLRLKAGQRYFPRFINEIIDLETQAIQEIKRGVGRRPGVRPGAFRQRYYEEVLDGMIKGKRYSTDYRAAVEMRLTAGNKAISDKMLADFLEPFGKIPLERMPEPIKARAWATARAFVGIKHFQSVVNRVLRGEKLTEATFKAQERRFPELGRRLRDAFGKPKELKRLIKDAKSLQPELQEAYWAARRVAVRAMARARVPILGKEGTINHASLQGRIFPVELSEPTNALIRGEITPHQVLNQLAKINAVARMGQTAIDTGFTLIQGLLTLANHPAKWGRAFGMAFQVLKNPKYWGQFSKIHKGTKTTITTHGGAPFGGTEFTEAARAGGWLEKIPAVGPVFRRFGLAFESYIDTSRVLIAEGKIAHYARKFGRDLTDRELTDIVTTVDHMVGIGSMRRLGMSSFTRGLATNLLYAPRYYLAFVSFLGRAFQGGVGGDIARQSLAKFLVALPAFMSAVAIALGQKDRILSTKDKPVPRMFDPRTGEFMTVEINDTHMGLGGVWIAGFRLLGSLTRSAIDAPEDFISLDPHENPLLRYWYGRGSPIASGAIDVITGRNYLGERLDTPMDYLHEIVDKTFPFWLAGQITDVPKPGWEKGLAEWWGLRAWMVQYREEARRHAEDHIKDIPREMIMPWQQMKVDEGRPLTYDDLNNEQRAWLLLNFEDFREAEEKRQERKAETGTDFEVADIRVREILDSAYETDLDTVAYGARIGQVSITDYQDQAEYLRRIRFGEYQYRASIRQFLDEERWEDVEKWIEENIKPEDKAYERYMEIRGNPPKVFGKPDWDAWKLNIDTYMNSLEPAIRDYIERRRDDWINNLPPNAKVIEQLIMECETVLDAYYAQEQGKARLEYRAKNPEADARLFILGRVTTLKSKQAQQIVQSIASQYGFPIVLPEEIAPERPTAEREDLLKRLRKARGLE